jgi:hypothetical protein
LAIEQEAQRSILTEEWEHELQDAVRSTRQVRVDRRLKAVQFVAEGYPVEDVARLC